MYRALILALAGCGDDGPVPDPLPPGRRSELDWAVILDAPLDARLHTVFALPGGDLIAVGYHGAQEDFGDSVLPAAHGRTTGLILRLSARGELVWAHSLGGTQFDPIWSAVRTEDGVWVSGELARLPLYLDGQELEVPPSHYTEGRYYAARFDLDGHLDRLVMPDAQGYGGGSVAEGPDGLVVLSASGEAYVGEERVEDIGAVAVRPDGSIAWAATGAGGWLLAVAGGVRLIGGGGNATLRTSRGAEARVDVPSGWSRNALISWDGERVTPGLLGLHTVNRVRREPDGQLYAYGNAGDWYGADGRAHAVGWLDGASWGVQARLDEDGAVVEATIGSLFALGGDGLRVGTGWIGTCPLDWPKSGGGTASVGPPCPDTWPRPAAPRDGLVTVNGDDGGVIRGFTLTGPDIQDPYDAAWDEDGGLVVVGAYRGGSLEVRDLEGRVLLHHDSPWTDEDAFVLRLLPDGVPPGW